MKIMDKRVCTCSAGVRHSLGDRLHFPGACCSGVTAEGAASSAEPLGLLQLPVLALQNHDLQRLVCSASPS